jgi:hypothetical protein
MFIHQLMQMLGQQNNIKQPVVVGKKVSSEKSKTITI